MQMISIIAAITKNNVLGKDNKMPWHLPAELQYFKKVTLGKPVIMGRKTFESIGRPLPGRENIVITRQVDFTPTGVTIKHDLQSAINYVKDIEEVMIIGGANLYQQAINFADKMYLTVIDFECEGDVFFPTWDDEQWNIIKKETHKADEQNKHDFVTVILERITYV